jgi:hypothetical protein
MAILVICLTYIRCCIIFRGDDRLSKEYKEIQTLLDDSKEQLYPNCKKGHSKLAPTLELLRFKAESGLSDKRFTKMLCIFKDILPDGNKLP